MNSITRGSQQHQTNNKAREETSTSQIPNQTRISPTNHLCKIQIRHKHVLYPLSKVNHKKHNTTKHVKKTTNYLAPFRYTFQQALTREENKKEK